MTAVGYRAVTIPWMGLSPNYSLAFTGALAEVARLWSLRENPKSADYGYDFGYGYGYDSGDYASVFLPSADLLSADLSVTPTESPEDCLT